jgi:hypothetical protein
MVQAEKADQGSGKRTIRMSAFLKRRWVPLLCAVVLMLALGIYGFGYSLRAHDIIILWLLLSAIAGWLVIRMLRRHTAGAKWLAEPPDLIAFLKRRWLLLSCLVLLAACSMLSVEGLPLRGLTIKEGHVHVEQGRKLFWWRRLRIELQRPDFGKLPRVLDSGYITLIIPIWLPLTAALGWLVFRELRWREKLAKATETVPSA